MDEYSKIYHKYLLAEPRHVIFFFWNAVRNLWGKKLISILMFVVKIKYDKY